MSGRAGHHDAGRFAAAAQCQIPAINRIVLVDNQGKRPAGRSAMLAFLVFGKADCLNEGVVQRTG